MAVRLPPAGDDMQIVGASDDLQIRFVPYPFPHSFRSTEGGARARWAAQMNIYVWPQWAMETDFYTMQDIGIWFIDFVLNDFTSRFELLIANKIISL